MQMQYYVHLPLHAHATTRVRASHFVSIILTMTRLFSGLIDSQIADLIANKLQKDKHVEALFGFEIFLSEIWTAIFGG